jgi:hypothetical protein
MQDIIAISEKLDKEKRMKKCDQKMPGLWVCIKRPN